jgi:hypothetical protein
LAIFDLHHGLEVAVPSTSGFFGMADLIENARDEATACQGVVVGRTKRRMSGLRVGDGASDWQCLFRMSGVIEYPREEPAA